MKYFFWIIYYGTAVPIIHLLAFLWDPIMYFQDWDPHVVNGWKQFHSNILADARKRLS